LRRVTNLLFNSHKTPGTLGRLALTNGSCARAAVEEVAEEFSDPVIGEKLINAEIDHECFAGSGRIAPGT